MPITFHGVSRAICSLCMAKDMTLQIIFIIVDDIIYILTVNNGLHDKKFDYY